MGQCMAVSAGCERQLEEIWRSGFPKDGTDIVRAFFSAFPPVKHAVAYWEEGRPVSMAFLLPAVWHVQGEALPSQYLYAAATLPAFRGRGIFAELLRYAHRYAEENGRAATFLRPGEPSLFSYYARLGYRAYFGVVTLTLLPESVAKPLLPVRMLTVAGYSELRTRYLSERHASWIEWPVSVMSYAVSAAGEGGVYCVGDAVAFCEPTPDELMVRELFCPPESRQAVLLSLAGHFGRRRVTAWTPAEDTEETVPVGMLCPHIPLPRADGGNPFMGLTLE